MLMSIIIAVVFTVIVLTLLLVLAPGMLVNMLFDRFSDDQDGFIVASMKDSFTWIFSGGFWALMYTLGKQRIERYVQHLRTIAGR